MQLSSQEWINLILRHFLVTFDWKDVNIVAGVGRCNMVIFVCMCVGIRFFGPIEVCAFVSCARMSCIAFLSRFCSLPGPRRWNYC
jgi:hypothetical protein